MRNQRFFRVIAVLSRAAGLLGIVFLWSCKAMPTGPSVMVAHTGSLRVISNPAGAAIWLDGSSTGSRTPATIVDLAPGNHKVTLKLGQSCVQDEDRIVAVAADETADVAVDLLPAIPVLLEPAAGAELDNGRYDGLDRIVWDFKWKEVKGASYYHLYVIGRTAVYPVINSYVYGLNFHYVSSGYIADFNRSNWQWRVRAYMNGTWCSWTETRYFDVERVNTDPPSN